MTPLTDRFANKTATGSEIMEAKEELVSKGIACHRSTDDYTLNRDLFHSLDSGAFDDHHALVTNTDTKINATAMNNLLGADELVERKSKYCINGFASLMKIKTNSANVGAYCKVYIEGEKSLSTDN